MKRMARDFQSQFNEAIREAELDSVKKAVDDLARIDPMADLRRKDMNKTNAEIWTELNKPAPGQQRPAGDAAVGPLPAAIPAPPDLARRRQGPAPAVRRSQAMSEPRKRVEASRAPLLEHLIELRARLIQAMIAVLIAFIVCFFFAKRIYNILLIPL